MLLSVTTRLARRRVRRLIDGDAAAWALRVPLVTLAVAAALAQHTPRR